MRARPFEKHQLTPVLLLMLPAVTLALHALINVLPTRILGYMNALSVFWHCATAFTLTVVVPAVAPTHQSWSFVFTEFYSDDTTALGAPSNA